MGPIVAFTLSSLRQNSGGFSSLSEFSRLFDARQGRTLEPGHLVRRDHALGDGRVALDGAGEHDGWNGEKAEAIDRSISWSNLETYLIKISQALIKLLFIGKNISRFFPTTKYLTFGKRPTTRIKIWFLQYIKYFPIFLHNRTYVAFWKDILMH